MARLRRPRPVVITDAAPSPADEQRRRRRTYTIIMVVHIVGFALAGLLYDRAWWLGLAMLIATTPLPWIAVVLANTPSRRTGANRVPRVGQVTPELNGADRPAPDHPAW
jgi:Protein of unknown function (DUF3099)